MLIGRATYRAAAPHPISRARQRSVFAASTGLVTGRATVTRARPCPDMAGGKTRRHVAVRRRGHPRQPVRVPISVHIAVGVVQLVRARFTVTRCYVR